MLGTGPLYPATRAGHLACRGERVGAGAHRQFHPRHPCPVGADSCPPTPRSCQQLPLVLKDRSVRVDRGGHMCTQDQRAHSGARESG